MDKARSTSRSKPIAVLLASRDLRSQTWMGGSEDGSTIWHQVRTLEEALLAIEAGQYDAIVFDPGIDPARWAALDLLRERAPMAAVIALDDGTANGVAAVRRTADAWIVAEGLTAGALLALVRELADRDSDIPSSEPGQRVFETVLRALSPAIAVLDASGAIRLANRAWRRLAERTTPDPARLEVGANYLAHLQRAARSDGVASELLAGIRAVIKGTLDRYETEQPCRLGDGSPEIWVVVDRMPPDHPGCVVTMLDLPKPGKDLAIGDDSFRALCDQLPDGLAVHQGEHLVFVNRAVLEVLGYPDASALLGRHVLELVHPDDRPLVVERIRTMATTGMPAPPVEQRLLRADGGVLVCEVSAVPVVFGGKPAFLVIGRDVQQRREVQARMMQLDRTLSVGLVAAGLGHEINNPLSFVNANVELALRSATELESALESDATSVSARRVTELCRGLREIREALTDARQGGRRIAAIVEDLRVFARHESEGSAPVAPEDVLQAAINMVKNEIRHRARLVKDYSVVPMVLANESRLSQVFLNLLANAAHAIPVGDAERHEIRIRLSSDGGWVVVEISDTGAGIAREDLSRIFEPFFTTKRDGQGTGLGLAICRSIVLGMGGEIDVSSEPGKGTTFRVRLRANEERLVRTKSTISPLRQEPKRRRVLVIDDEALIGRVIARCLGRDHEVKWVGGGREGIEQLGGAERFDVVLLDVMMPDLTGVDVYQWLAQHRPEQLERVVFLTGGAFTDEARAFLAKVPNRKVSKPFEPSALRELVESFEDLPPKA